MPAELDSEELLAFLNKRRGLLDGVCVTGGEPLLRPDLPELLAQIKELGYPVKLDTNGGRPAQLRTLAEQDLVDYVAMDVKNSPARYGETAGVPGLDLAPFRESVSFLLQGTVDYEFRTTVVREFHDADSFRAIGPWITGAKRYFLQSFVDRDTVLREGLHPWDGETLGALCGPGPALCGAGGAAGGIAHKNRETAQYTSSRAIMVFTTRACRENRRRNTDPKADQHRVNTKPMKASSRAKRNRITGRSS